MPAWKDCNLLPCLWRGSVYSFLACFPDSTSCPMSPLLTLTLATGIAFSETLFGKAMEFNHKTLFSILSWLIFAALLLGRYVWGWRGRKALRWTLAGFAALLFAYVGSRFVLEVILGRTG